MVNAFIRKLFWILIAACLCSLLIFFLLKPLGTLNAMIASFVAVSSLCWVASRWIGRRWAEPLLTLEGVAHDLARGRRNFSHNWRSWGEFAPIGRFIQQLAESICEKIQVAENERSQLSAVLSSLDESVIAIDFEGKIFLINAAAENLFQIRFSQVKGLSFREVFRHADFVRFLEEAQRNLAPEKKEMTLLTPDEKVLIVRATPLVYDANRTGILTTLHNMTELRKLERVRQEFVANVSHELKTPLASIQGFVETLLDGALEDPKHNRDFLKTILEHSKHLDRLIDDLLDLSTMEARAAEVTLSPIDLKPLVDRLLQALGPLMKEKELTAAVHFPAQCPSVLADSLRLPQVLMNLLDNAVKFNKRSGSIYVDADVRDEWLHLSVTDTGVGIPEDALPRIFERFYRVDTAHNHDIPGTGLGLSIVKHAMEKQGGHISVKSRLGQGSTFTIALPVSR